MELTITGFNGITQHLHVDDKDTIGDLKQLILQLFNVNPSQQKLSANNGQRINLDDDSRSLSSCRLHYTVALLITNPGPMKVFVRNEKGITSTYTVDRNETVDQLQRKIYNVERFPVDQQRLIYNGRQLEHGKKLHDFDIKPGSTIHMTFHLLGH